MTTSVQASQYILIMPNKNQLNY